MLPSSREVIYTRSNNSDNTITFKTLFLVAGSTAAMVAISMCKLVRDVSVETVERVACVNRASQQPWREGQEALSVVKREGCASLNDDGRTENIRHETKPKEVSCHTDGSAEMRIGNKQWAALTSPGLLGQRQRPI